jgi:predicted nucleic acid-binding protein
MIQYDPNAWKKSWQNYFGQKALTTGVQPSAQQLGELGLAELKSRYEAGEAAKDRELRERLIKSQIASANFNSQMAAQALSAQKKTAGINNMANLGSLGLSAVALANKMGLFSNTQKNFDNSVFTSGGGDVDSGLWTTDYSNYDWGTTSMPSIVDSLGNDISDYDWTWVEEFDGF